MCVGSGNHLYDSHTETQSRPHARALGAFTLELGQAGLSASGEKAGSVLARAEETSAVRNGPRPATAVAPGRLTFEIEHEGKQYILEQKGSVWRRKGVLYEGEREIGVVAQESIFTRRARVELPEELPLVLRLFVIWLTVPFGKRDAEEVARIPPGGEGERNLVGN